MTNDLEQWKKAGLIASEAREYGKTLLIENANVLEIIKKVEDFIYKKEGKLAFPTQISINNLAAHYIPTTEENLCLKAGDIAKLDLGVHIDGFIGDTALTIEIGTNKNEALVNASKKALEEAIKICKPGTKVSEIGEVIDSTISSFGFKPIKNLSGHRIEQYTLHGNISIPNFNNKDKSELEEGMVIAIEPFATTGSGLIKEGKPSGVYRIYNLKPIRDPISREVLKFIEKEFNNLPFAKHHLLQKFTLPKINIALMNLEKQGIIYHYPQLPERDNTALVSQHEHTIYISKTPIVLTQ